MFKPHSLFIKKKSNEADFDLDAANEAWNKLSDSKLTKFVRKAEKAYDSHVASLVSYPLFRPLFTCSAGSWQVLSVCLLGWKRFGVR